MTDSSTPPVILRDVRVPLTGSSDTLSADVYLPATTPAPVLVTVVPYRKDMGTGYEASLAWFAEQGYVAVLVEQRGIGSSDGTPRAKYDEAEAQDAVCVIEWAAAQPWSTGRIGMWGMSYGGHMTLRAAAMRPAALQAIIPIMCTLDSGRDVAHPHWTRGDFLPVALWGGSMLVQQLLPGLVDGESEAERRRWHRRLHDVEPYVLDIARTGPDAQAWAQRAIDPDRIEVPALCVGGWQDVFTDAVPELYERIRGPKRLIMGPWGHILPQDSQCGPIDFLPMAKQWWDHWLRDVPNAAMDEPPAIVFVPGAVPAWQSLRAWPPPGRRMRLHASPDGRLVDEQPPEARLGLECPADATVGALSGLRGIGMGDFGLPQDQHDDDARSLTFTSDRLPGPVLLAGRVGVSVRVAERPPAGEWVAVRLSDVDGEGRSTIVSSAVLVFDNGEGDVLRLDLDTAVRRIPAGHRLRIGLSRADLPRLSQQPSLTPVHVDTLEVSIPMADPNTAVVYEVPALANEPADGHWSIERDLLDGKAAVVVGERHRSVTAEGHRLEADRRCRVRASTRDPRRAITTSVHRTTVHFNSGKVVRVTASISCARGTVRVRGLVSIDGRVFFDRWWTTPLWAGK
ncbi:CocE/NonD family hydrolase [Dactylosporangium roseum]|uniref:CocE/NonD family hydrolase n=1 Tax=Dactylosporangium roseum TaxID=47989 RepID=A0ABY5Z168_9ACTN|nr:CocE/NonD family hydrolase [Dactylosporangium roseum]UWZ34828.1 CocE/NonD family hydrolase [Dactylosporangium roseum]